MTDTIEILDRLIAFDTTSAKSNLALIDFVQDYLIKRGFKVTRVPDQTGQKAGLFAALGPEGAGILLSAHSDVVPVDGQTWTRDPFRLTGENDRLYGRGTTDMKGFLAAMLSCAERATGVELGEPLKLSISYDEEVGCLGMAHMIGDLPGAIGRPRACIVGEPTDMQVAVGHKGKVAMRARFSGEAGHSSLAPEFVNAIHMAVDFVNEIRALQADFAKNGNRDPDYDVPYTTFHIGKIEGGRALNMIPEQAEVTFECRHLAVDDPDEILQRICAIGEGLSDRYARGNVSIEVLSAYPGLDVPADSGAVPLASRLAGTTETRKVAFGTEAGYFDGLGIPTVVCGPGSMAGQGHKPDEFILASQLSACDVMLDRVLDDLKRK